MHSRFISINVSDCVVRVTCIDVSDVEWGKGIVSVEVKQTEIAKDKMPIQDDIFLFHDLQCINTKTMYDQKLDAYIHDKKKHGAFINEVFVQEVLD